MDSQFGIVEASQELLTGTPLPCRRRMPTQNLESWTAASVTGSALSLLLALPRALVLVPAVIRRRA